MEKAFDRIRWDFLAKIMEKINFPRQWIQWNLACITSAPYYLLLNGETSGAIRPSNEVRQGDPISPFLFILVASTLSCHIRKLQEQCLITGFKHRGMDIGIAHSLFADDVIIFGRTTIKEMNFKKP